MKERSIHLNVTFMPDNQASKIPKPCKRAFNNPSFMIAPEFSAILRFRLLSVFAMWNNQVDLKLLM